MADPKASGSISSERPHPDRIGGGDHDEQHDGVPDADMDATGTPNSDRLRSETAHKPDPSDGKNAVDRPDKPAT